MNIPDDPELQDLLRQLDEESSSEAEPEPTGQIGGSTEPVVTEQPLEPEVVAGDPSPDLILDNSAPPTPLQRELPQIITGPEFAAEQSGPAIDVRSMVARFNDMAGELLEHCRGDRAGLQSLIERLDAELQNGGVANAPRVVLEALVKAHEVKADVVNNMTKIMETGAKYIAASKSAQLNVGVVNATVEDRSLEEILSTPMNPNEDFDG